MVACHLPGRRTPPSLTRSRGKMSPARMSAGNSAPRYSRSSPEIWPSRLRITCAIPRRKGRIPTQHAPSARAPGAGVSSEPPSISSLVIGALQSTFIHGARCLTELDAWNALSSIFLTIQLPPCTVPEPISMVRGRLLIVAIGDASSNRPNRRFFVDAELASASQRDARGVATGQITERRHVWGSPIPGHHAASPSLTGGAQRLPAIWPIQPVSRKINFSTLRRRLVGVVRSVMPWAGRRP